MISNILIRGSHITFTLAPKRSAVTKLRRRGMTECDWSRKGSLTELQLLLPMARPSTGWQRRVTDWEDSPREVSKYVPALFPFIFLSCAVLALISSPTESISSKGSKEDNLQVESATHPWVKHTETSFPGKDVCLPSLPEKQSQVETQMSLLKQPGSFSQARFCGFQTDAKGGLDTLVHCFHPCWNTGVPERVNTEVVWGWGIDCPAGD